MESFYQRKCKFLQRSDRQQLAASTGLTERQVQSCLPVSHSVYSERLQVKIWFQNRRMKEKKESPVVESSSACSTRCGQHASFHTHSYSYEPTASTSTHSPTTPALYALSTARIQCVQLKPTAHASLVAQRYAAQTGEQQSSCSSDEAPSRTTQHSAYPYTSRSDQHPSVSSSGPDYGEYTWSVCQHAHAQVRTCTRRHCSTCRRSRNTPTSCHRHHRQPQALMCT
jgi:hypothetical protein